MSGCLKVVSKRALSVNCFYPLLHRRKTICSTARDGEEMYGDTRGGHR